jgi:hypothetical protein
LKIAFDKKLKLIDKNASYAEVFTAAREIKTVKLTEGRKEIIFRTEFPDKAALPLRHPLRLPRQESSLTRNLRV